MARVEIKFRLNALPPECMYIVHTTYLCADFAIVSDKPEAAARGTLMAEVPRRLTVAATVSLVSFFILDGVHDIYCYVCIQ